MLQPDPSVWHVPVAEPDIVKFTLQLKVTSLPDTRTFPLAGVVGESQSVKKQFKWQDTDTVDKCYNHGYRAIQPSPAEGYQVKLLI